MSKIPPVPDTTVDAPLPLSGAAVYRTRSDSLPATSAEQSGKSEQSAPASEDETTPDGIFVGFWESDGTPAGLISLIVHTVLLIILMLCTIGSGDKDRWVINARVGPPTDVDQPLAVFEMPIQPPEVDSQSEAMAENVDASRMAVAPDLASQVTAFAPPLSTEGAASADSAESEANEMEAAAKEIASILSPGFSSSDQRMVMRLPTGGMSPRTPQSRAELGAMYGATRASEDAVEMALAWLAEHQQRNGSWSFDLTIDPCRGRCSHSRSAGENATPATAATGLSLLAFLGAGYTHREGKYAEVVRRGVYYLRDAARPATHGLDLQAGSMYGHGIATLALTEILAIDRYNNQVDTEIKELVEGAVLFTLVAQHQQGGWRYVPGSPGDMTISGWQILSLVSARYGGIPLRTNTLSDAKSFVNSLSHDGTYEFGYITKRPEPTTTAIGLCMLMYLGESPFQTPFSRSLSKMAARGPKKFDVYHDYYATMALHNARHPDWDHWHKPLRDHLVRTQATTGHERGSWHFKDHHGDVGGRLYTTAMAAMILEVYYRYMPLYQNRDLF